MVTRHAERCSESEARCVLFEHLPLRDPHRLLLLLLPLLLLLLLLLLLSFLFVDISFDTRNGLRREEGLCVAY